MKKDFAKTPVATILMPVYNAEKYLRESIESILNQTYQEFDFLIINDGSTDKSVEIIETYKDKRIKLIHNKNNKGLIYTLNKGLNLINSKYIIRMDADDISLPKRISIQIQFMDNNPKIGISGTHCLLFKNKIIKRKKKDLFKSHENIKQQLIFSSSLMHPTVIIRNSVLKQYDLKYRSKYLHVEDYGLWVEALKYTKLANIPNILLKYRVSKTNITSTANKNKKERIHKHSLIFQNILNIHKINFNEKDLVFHSEMFIYGANKISHFYNMNIWLNKIKQTGKIKNEVLSGAYWQFYYLSVQQMGLKSFFYFLKFKKNYEPFSFNLLFKLFLKCFLFRK